MSGSEANYKRLHDLLDYINEPNRSIYRRMLNEHAERFRHAAGSSHNHQPWDGGFWDHTVETMNIYWKLFEDFEDRFPFMPEAERPTLSDGLLVMALHDIEKPWGYVIKNSRLVFSDNERPKPAGLWADKKERRGFAKGVIAAYGFDLSPSAQNALTFVEGIPDELYTPNERLMGRLAALCHSADVISARTCHDFPLPNDEDPWEGAERGVCW